MLRFFYTHRRNKVFATYKIKQSQYPANLQQYDIIRSSEKNK